MKWKDQGFNMIMGEQNYSNRRFFQIREDELIEHISHYYSKLLDEESHG